LQNLKCYELSEMVKEVRLNEYKHLSQTNYMHTKWRITSTRLIASDEVNIKLLGHDKTFTENEASL